jgi:hypothetical protein
MLKIYSFSVTRAPPDIFPWDNSHKYCGYGSKFHPNFDDMLITVIRIPLNIFPWDISFPKRNITRNKLLTKYVCYTCNQLKLRCNNPSGHRRKQELTYFIPNIEIVLRTINSSSPISSK